MLLGTYDAKFAQHYPANQRSTDSAMPAKHSSVRPESFLDAGQRQVARTTGSQRYLGQAGTRVSSRPSGSPAALPEVESQPPKAQPQPSDRWEAKDRVSAGTFEAG